MKNSEPTAKTPLKSARGKKESTELSENLKKSNSSSKIVNTDSSKKSLKGSIIESKEGKKLQNSTKRKSKLMESTFSSQNKGVKVYKPVILKKSKTPSKVLKEKK